MSRLCMLAFASNLSAQDSKANFSPSEKGTWVALKSGLVNSFACTEMLWGWQFLKDCGLIWVWHLQNLPVRGQRTKTNARTRKGKHTHTLQLHHIWYFLFVTFSQYTGVALSGPKCHPCTPKAWICVWVIFKFFQSQYLHIYPCNAALDAAFLADITFLCAGKAKTVAGKKK